METTQMFFNWQMDKVWCIHTMEYYFAIKRNKLLIPVQSKCIILTEETRFKRLHTI